MINIAEAIEALKNGKTCYCASTCTRYSYDGGDIILELFPDFQRTLRRNGLWFKPEEITSQWDVTHHPIIEPCPFCKKDIDHIFGKHNEYRVECLGCSYSSGKYSDASTAIKVHNDLCHCLTHRCNCEQFRTHYIQKLELTR